MDLSKKPTRCREFSMSTPNLRVVFCCCLTSVLLGCTVPNPPLPTKDAAFREPHEHSLTPADPSTPVEETAPRLGAEGDKSLLDQETSPYPGPPRDVIQNEETPKEANLAGEQITASKEANRPDIDDELVALWREDFERPTVQHRAQSKIRFSLTVQANPRVRYHVESFLGRQRDFF
jgi:hypothetical protein